MKEYKSEVKVIWGSLKKDKNPQSVENKILREGGQVIIETMEFYVPECLLFLITNDFLECLDGFMNNGRGLIFRIV